MSTPEKPTIERRHHRRVVFHGPAELQVQGFPPIPIRTLNISVGGLSSVAAVNLAPDTQCVIHMDIPDKGSRASVELPAQLVHSVLSKIDDGFILNFRFINLSARAAALIARFMASVG